MLYLAFVAVGVHSLVSPKEFAQEQKRRPGTTRMDHLMNTGVPYVFFPVLAWVLVFPVGWNGGVLIPALPWALMILFAAVVLPGSAAVRWVRGVFGKRSVNG